MELIVMEGLTKVKSKVKIMIVTYMSSVFLDDNIRRN